MGLFDKLKGKGAKEAKSKAETELKDKANANNNEKKEESIKVVSENTTVNTTTTVTDSPDRDLSNSVEFLTQFSKDVGDVDGDGDHDMNDENIACCAASKLMIQRAGFKTVNANKRIDAGVFDAAMNVVKAKTVEEAHKLLFDNLEKGMPALVGVNRKKKSVGNANVATSHFVVVVARRLNSVTGVPEYRFYDPGTSYKNKGTAKDQWFTLNTNGLYEGVTKYSGVKYTITEVRPTSK